MLVLIVLLLLVLFAAPDPSPAVTSAPPHPRCVAAEPSVLRTIDDDLDNGWMVQREDSPLMWYVASDVDGGDIGLWIVTGLDDNGMPEPDGIGIMSANDGAREATDWPDAGLFGLDAPHDDADIAMSCVA